MEPQPSQYPSAPQPATPGDLAPPPYRIHSLTGVVLATFCGMPLGGSVVLAINYWRWGQKPHAVAVVAGGLLTTAVIAWLAVILPAAVPAVAFLLPQPLIGFLAARWLQGRRIDAHRAAGGARVSPGIDALIGLGVSAVTIGPFIALFLAVTVIGGLNPDALMNRQEYVDFGDGQLVYYFDGATREDAQQLGEALVNGGYFDDSAPNEVAISGHGTSREISFAAPEGAWDDPAHVGYIEELSEYIAPDIGGKPFTVLLLDPNLYEQRRCTLIDTWQCAPSG